MIREMQIRDEQDAAGDLEKKRFEEFLHGYFRQLCEQERKKLEVQNADWYGTEYKMDGWKRKVLYVSDDTVVVDEAPKILKRNFWLKKTKPTSWGAAHQFVATVSKMWDTWLARSRVQTDSK